MRFDKLTCMINNVLLFLMLCIGYFAPLALAAIDLWSQTVIHIISVFIAVLYLFKFMNKKTFTFDIPYWKYFLLWFVFYFISYICAANKSAARMDICNMINGVFLFYCAVNIKNLISSTDDLLRWWGYVVFVIGVLVCYQLYTDYTSVEKQASMVNPNILAGYVLFWLPYWYGKIAEYMRIKNISGIIMAVTASVFITVSIVVTNSVTAWIALALAFCFVYFICEKRKVMHIFNMKVTKYYTAVGILVISALLCINSKIMLSIYERICWAAVAIRMALDHPFLGIGPGGFADAFVFFKRGNFLNTLYAHNIIFHMAAEIGIPGLIMFVWLTIKIIKSFIKKYSPEARLLIIGYIAFLIKSLVDYSFSIPANLFIFWIWTGLIVSILYPNSHVIRIPIISKTALCINIIIILLLIPGITDLFLFSRNIAKGKINVQEKQYTQAEQRFTNASLKHPAYPEPYAESAIMYFNRFNETGKIIFIELALYYIEKSIKYNKYNLLYQRARDDYYRQYQIHPMYR
ncbi:MAG: O-antigen ligase family protein [bacterium]